MKQVGRFSAIGIEMGAAVFIGVFGGNYLDSRFDTEPVFLWVGLVFGIGAAAKAVVDAAKKAKKILEEDDGNTNSTKD